MHANDITGAPWMRHPRAPGTSLSYRLEQVLLPDPPGQTALNFAACRLGDCAGGNKHDDVDGDLMLIGDRLADAGGNLLDCKTGAGRAFHFLHQYDLLLVIFGHQRECGPAMPAQRRMAVVDGVFDVLRIVIDAAHDDEILDAAGNEQLSRFVREAEITRAQPLVVAFIRDARLKHGFGRLRVAPIAPADMRSADPHLAD